jgi:hypothetical protein
MTGKGKCGTVGQASQLIPRKELKKCGTVGQGCGLEKDNSKSPARPRRRWHRRRHSPEVRAIIAARLVHRPLDLWTCCPVCIVTGEGEGPRLRPSSRPAYLVPLAGGGRPKHPAAHGLARRRIAQRLAVLYALAITRGCRSSITNRLNFEET